MEPAPLPTQLPPVPPGAPPARLGTVWRWEMAWGCVLQLREGRKAAYACLFLRLERVGAQGKFIYRHVSKAYRHNTPYIYTSKL